MANAGPTWTTVAVALVSAAAGGVVGTILSTWLQIRHQRTAELRTRMLLAADEFVTAARKAIKDLVRAASELDSHPEWVDHEKKMVADEVHELMFAVDDLIDAADAALSRVQLLFGEETQAGRFAHEIVWQLRRAVEARAFMMAGAERTDYEQAVQVAVGSLSHFNFHARRELIRGALQKGGRRRPWWTDAEEDEPSSGIDLRSDESQERPE